MKPETLTLLTLIITTLGPIILGLIGLRAIKLKGKEFISKVEENTQITKKAEAKLVTIETEVVEVKSTLVEVKKQTDGLTDKLVKSEKQQSETLGIEIGRQQIKDENGIIEPWVISLDDDAYDLERIRRIVKTLNITKYKEFSESDLLMENLKPDVNLYILDHILSEGGTGFNLVEKIFSMNPNNIIVVPTGMKNPDVIKTYYEMGITKVIEKDDPDFDSIMGKTIAECLDKVAKRK